MRHLWWQSAKSWYARDPFTRSAAISYYTIFSFPSLLILLVGFANMLIDENIIKGEIVGYLEMIMGRDAARETFQAVDRVNVYHHNALILTFSVVMLLFTGLRLFLQIQKALNDVWDVPDERFHWKSLLLRRAYSFGVMLAIGFVLLVSLLVTSVLTGLSEWLAVTFTSSTTAFFHALNFAFSFSMLSFLFCLILRILPDRHVPWAPAWRGGAASAMLFLLGQYGLTFYFELARPESAYGVSGSLILLMLWVSYSSLALLFGAEFAKATMQDSSPRQQNGCERHCRHV